MERVILDLCAGSGSWSKPYVEAGYKVIPVTLPDDVRLWQYHDKVHGILASPPCTVFSRAGQWVKRSPEDMLQAVGVVDACLRLVVVCRPQWWALENPVGTLRRWLGRPKLYFDPCDYGDPWTKRTCLWGQFTPPPKGPVRPTEGSRITDKLSSWHEKKHGLRSLTPPGFARAFFLANP
jgi:site-specific DNA-cytosine methylase